MNIHRKFIPSLIGIILSLGILGSTLFFTFQKKTIDTNILSVSFLDVGQGDAIYILAPNGNDVLIDGGPHEGISPLLRSVMPLFDNDIDIVIATHPDKDHIAGLAQVFEDFQVNTFIDSEIRSGTSFDKKLHTFVIDEPNSESIIARSGERFILDEIHGVYLDILYPYENTLHVSDTNSASIVAKLTYGNTSFLLTGDAPIATEDFLIKNEKQNLDIDVLKLGHHGSKTSTSDAFLEATTPIYAVVSAGKNNSYHHPHASVINRVRNHGATILSTIDSGTITFSTDGVTLWKK